MSMFPRHPFDLSDAERAADARLRWRILQVLHACRVGANGGWIGGRMVYDVATERQPVTVAGDERFIGLLRDLVAKRFAEETDTRVRHSQPFGLDHLNYRITAPGISFVNGTHPADADIADGRIAPGNPAPGTPGISNH